MVTKVKALTDTGIFIIAVVCIRLRFHCFCQYFQNVSFVFTCVPFNCLKLRYCKVVLVRNGHLT